MTPKLVIFDMDGLMLDTEQISYKYFQEVCAESGFTFSHDMLEKIVGYSDKENIRTLSEEFPGCDAEAIFEEVYRRYKLVVSRGDVPVKPGLFELLDELEKRRIKKAIASTTISDTATKLLEAKGLLSRFDGAVFGDMVENHKPAPDTYNACLELFAFGAEQCIVLEDSASGASAALAAGIPVIMVPDIIEPDADLESKLLAKCDNLREVIKYLGVME